MKKYIIALAITFGAWGVKAVEKNIPGFDVIVMENDINQTNGTYNFSYILLNLYSDSYFFSLRAKNEQNELVIKHKLTNINQNFEVDSGVIHAPKVQFTKLEALEKKNGVFFKSQNPKAGVIRLHGSEGGMSAFSHAKSFYMALNGFDAYAFCYFNCPFLGAPNNLHEVDVAKVYDALVDMKSNYKVALWGGSRGAELTAILSSFLPQNNLVQADAYIADRPIHVVVPAFFYHYQDPTNWRDGIVGQAPIEENWIGEEDGPHLPKQGWVWSRNNSLQFTNFSLIEIEHSQAPYLNIHGTGDQIWPSQFSSLLEDRIEESKKDTFFYNSGDYVELSHKQFQFHYFEQVNHAFSETWAQVLRAKLEVEFLDQSLSQ